MPLHSYTVGIIRNDSANLVRYQTVLSDIFIHTVPQNSVCRLSNSNRCTPTYCSLRSSVNCSIRLGVRIPVSGRAVDDEDALLRQEPYILWPMTVILSLAMSRADSINCRHSTYKTTRFKNRWTPRCPVRGSWYAAPQTPRVRSETVRSVRYRWKQRVQRASRLSLIGTWAELAWSHPLRSIGYFDRSPSESEHRSFWLQVSWCKTSAARKGGCRLVCAGLWRWVFGKARNDLIDPTRLPNAPANVF